MRDRAAPSLLLALALLAAGCGHKAPATVNPDPGPTTGTPGGPSGPSNPGGNTGPGANTDNAAAVTANLRTEVGNVIHFDYDQDAIKPEDRDVLDRKAAIMLANSALRIRVSGHADDRGSDEYNLVLGNKRALAAKRYLEGKGVDGSRIEVTSYGEERPVDPAQNEAAWSKNRRDEFEIIAGGDRLVSPR